jgi:hypothetical protein
MSSTKDQQTLPYPHKSSPPSLSRYSLGEMGPSFPANTHAKEFFLLLFGTRSKFFLDLVRDPSKNCFGFPGCYSLNGPGAFQRAPAIPLRWGQALSLMFILCSALSSRQPLLFGGKAGWPQGFPKRRHRQPKNSHG